MHAKDHVGVECVAFLEKIELLKTRDSRREGEWSLFKEFKISKLRRKGQLVKLGGGICGMRNAFYNLQYIVSAIRTRSMYIVELVRAGVSSNSAAHMYRLSVERTLKTKQK